MNKFASFALVVLPVLAVLFTTPVFADSPGQLSNGPSNYKVRNVTQNGAYAQSVAATCNETVKYSITLNNSDFGLLRNVMVNANMQSGAISASATNADNQTTSVAGNAKVNVTNGTLAYVPGSTVRITGDGATSTPLSDGIVSGGVNAGNLNGSTSIFVQFQAKVNCPTTPPQTPETPKTPEAPVELPHTGATGVFAFVASLVTLVAAYVVTARKNVLG